MRIEKDSFILPTDFYADFTRSLSEKYPSDVICDVIFHSNNLIPVFHAGESSVVVIYYYLSVTIYLTVTMFVTLYNYSDEILKIFDT